MMKFILKLIDKVILGALARNEETMVEYMEELAQRRTFLRAVSEEVSESSQIELAIGNAIEDFERNYKPTVEADEIDDLDKFVSEAIREWSEEEQIDAVQSVQAFDRNVARVVADCVRSEALRSLPTAEELRA